MRRGASYALLALLAGFQTASAEPLLAVDIMFMNGDDVPTFGDHFDDGFLGEPDWFIVSGEPTESGTHMNMNAGDFVFHPQEFDEQENVFVAGLMTENLTAGTSGFFVLMNSPEDWIALGVVNGGVYVMDETLTALGVNGLGGVSDIAFKLFSNSADSSIIIEVNETVVYEGPNEMGAVQGVAFLVIPEPSMLALFGVGAVVGVRRRRHA